MIINQNATIDRLKQELSNQVLIEIPSNANQQELEREIKNKDLMLDQLRKELEA